ncbi:hypothetical protein L598_000700000610 [Mesorhizobium sp. J18]|nr:hypothetical protein [Mesorhizobium sp. J18]TWG90305.1 hypothetical protein L598_000700000610 [Mesorhizobium sp. J18]
MTGHSDIDYELYLLGLPEHEREKMKLLAEEKKAIEEKADRKEQPPKQD